MREVKGELCGGRASVLLVPFNSSETIGESPYHGRCDGALMKVQEWEFLSIAVFEVLDTIQQKPGSWTGWISELDDGKIDSLLV